MRTRRSPRNQAALWRYLGGPAPRGLEFTQTCPGEIVGADVDARTITVRLATWPGPVRIGESVAVRRSP